MPYLFLSYHCPSRKPATIARLLLSLINAAAKSAQVESCPAVIAGNFNLDLGNKHAQLNKIVMKVADLIDEAITLKVYATDDTSPQVVGQYSSREQNMDHVAVDEALIKKTKSKKSKASSGKKDFILILTIEGQDQVEPRLSEYIEKRLSVSTPHPAQTATLVSEDAGIADSLRKPSQTPPPPPPPNPPFPAAVLVALVPFADKPAPPPPPQFPPVDE